MSETTTSNNPVGRLHWILTYFVSPHMKSVRDALSDAFGVSREDSLRLTQCLTSVLKLIDESKILLMREIGEYDEETVKYITQIENNFKSISLATQRNGISISSEAMAALSMSAKFLSKASTENVLDDDVVNELLTEVNSLIDSVLYGELDKTLRTILLKRLESIRMALMQYRVCGSEGLEDAVEGFVGATFLNNDAVSKQQDKPEVQRSFSFVRKVMTNLNIYDIGLKLIDDGLKIYGLIHGQPNP